MQRLWIAALALACGLISPALAQDAGQVESKPLTGSFYMAPSIDAEDPNAPRDHIIMTLTGDAAKAMWDAMKVKTVPDECVGRMSRWVQSLICYGPSTDASQPLAAGESPYACYLGIDLKTAQVDLAQDC